MHKNLQLYLSFTILEKLSEKKKKQIWKNRLLDCVSQVCFHCGGVGGVNKVGSNYISVTALCWQQRVSNSKCNKKGRKFNFFIVVMEICGEGDLWVQFLGHVGVRQLWGFSAFLFQTWCQML